MAHTVLSLFTGAGGLDLGLEAAGFEVRLCVEVDPDARRTLQLNRPQWPLAIPGDINAVEPVELLRQAKLKPGEVSLLAGGPPCQPFSKSAYWSKGDSGRLSDPRAETLRAYLRVVEAALPRVLLIENVKGLAFRGKDEGLRFLQTELEAINRRCATRYGLQVIHLNTAAFGVPQFRERVFLIATVDGQTFSLPRPTHGRDVGQQSYRTSWDAIGDLDAELWPKELEPKGKWAGLLPSIPEGRNYLWHTPRNIESGGEPLFGWRTKFWSFLLKLAKNEPAWTIQAAPGPATGPFHWRSRRLSIDELLRLQTFPLGYQIEGSRMSAHRQVGNAVPSAIGELFGLEIRRQVHRERVRRGLHLIPPVRGDCPPPEPPSRVPRPYLALRAKHRDHPGIGLGPAARRWRDEKKARRRYA